MGNDCCINKNSKIHLIIPKVIESSNSITPFLSLRNNRIKTYNTDTLIYPSMNKFNSNNLLNIQLTHNEFIKGISKGRGKFGETFYGLCSMTGEIIIIKVYDNISIDKRDKIIFNLNKLYHLKHKNILSAIPLLDGDNINNDISDRFLSIIYEYCNGTNIEELIKNFGTLEEELIQKYSKDILKGLEYLNNENVNPTNLTLKNIFIDRNGIIRLGDVFVDTIILGNGKEIYERLLNNNLNNNEINYYIPSFFIKKIIKDNIYEINQSYTLWILGCLLIEMYSGNKPWSNYSFENQKSFFNFLSKTKKIPEIPNTLSKAGKEFINHLFDYNYTCKKDIFDKLLHLDFFTSNIIRKNYNKTIKIKKKKEQLGKYLQKNNVKNILNEKGNETFSISEISSII